MKLTIRNVTDELLKIENCECGKGVAKFFFVDFDDVYVSFVGCDYCGKYERFDTWLLMIEATPSRSKD